MEAESVAYIVCRRAGLDVAPFSFPDPPSWAGSDPRSDPGRTILASAEHATKTATAISRQVDAIARDHAAAAQPTQRRVTLQPAEARLIAMHRQAEHYFAEQLPASWVPGYLAGRGLAGALETDTPWRIGYAPDSWTGLADHLRARGYTDEEIITSGLGKRARTGDIIDRFRDRVMIPVRDTNGTTIAFIGRANPRTPEAAGHPVPKYLNSPQTPLYTKGNVLFGLDAARRYLRSGAMPVLVEGTFDAMAVHAADVDHRYAPVAPSGTALTREQIAALGEAVDLKERGVLVAFDGDSAGRSAAVRAHELLQGHTDRLHYAPLGAGDDPAGLLETRGPQQLLAALDNRGPLAGLVLDDHLDASRELEIWHRREDAARCIISLTSAEAVRRLARADVPGPDSTPANAVLVQAVTVASIAPPTTNHLITRAADAIGVPITEMMNTVVQAAGERPTTPQVEALRAFAEGAPTLTTSAELPTEADLATQTEVVGARTRPFQGRG